MRPIVSYPVILTGDVAGTVDFYRRHLDFKALFESDWYVHLQSTRNRRINLAVMDGDHETVPEAGRGRTSSILINFEVEDPDGGLCQGRRCRADDPVPVARRTLRPTALHHRRSQWGMLDIIKPIPPAAEFAAHYAAALPG